MANSETTQQVSAKAEALFSEAEAEALFAEAKAITQHVSAKAEALIAEAKAIIANFRLNRDGRELNERLLALGIALTPMYAHAESEIEKKLLALLPKWREENRTGEPLWGACQKVKRRDLELKKSDFFFILRRWVLKKKLIKTCKTYYPQMSTTLEES